MQISKINSVNFGNVTPIKGNPENIKALDDLLWDKCSNSNYGIVNLEDQSCTECSFWSSEISRAYGGQQLALLTGKDWGDYVTQKTSTNSLKERIDEDASIINVDSLNADEVNQLMEEVDYAE